MSSDETNVILGWVDRFRAGDDSAMNDLLAHFGGRLMRLTRKMLSAFPTVERWEQTDDVYQKAAMRLRQTLRKARPNSSREFFGLAAVQIHRELLNLAGTHQHRLSPSRVGAIGPESGASSSVQSSEPLDASEGPDELQSWTDFHEAAAALPDENREVFNLIWYDGLKEADAAAVLGVSLRTVSSRWQKARVAIHRAMGGCVPGS
jgi:RNA polymerase sigma factor (sigma-70 family)